MTYNENIRIFVDISHHIELQDKNHDAIGISTHAFIIESNFKSFSSFKHKWHKSKKGKEVIQGSKNEKKNNSNKRVANVFEKGTKPRWLIAIVEIKVSFQYYAINEVLFYVNCRLKSH